MRADLVGFIINQVFPGKSFIRKRRDRACTPESIYQVMAIGSCFGTQACPYSVSVDPIFRTGGPVCLP